MAPDMKSLEMSKKNDLNEYKEKNHRWNENSH
jgi:hypothetical protein